MKKLSWKKVGCLLLALLMAATMLATGAMAYDNAADQTGSITIHKFEQKDSGQDKWPEGDPGDGTVIEDTASLGTPLANVEFSIWNVTGTYTGSEDATTIVTTDLGEATDVQTTGADGVATFAGLDVGVYLVAETNKDPHTTRVTPNFFVSIPMTNPEGDGWLYDVHVYPKNALVRGDVTLNKVDEAGEALEGAIFGLYARDEDSSDDVAIAQMPTGADGVVKFTDLPVGNYYLKEITAPEGYTLSTVTYPFEITAENWHATFEANAINYLALTKDDLTKEYTGYEGALDINWQVTASIPGDINLYQTFKLTDNVPDGLAAAKNIVVTVGDDILTPNEDYILTNPIEEGSNDFTIDFTNNKASLKDHKSVVITFTTAITEEATVGQVTNSVALTYQSETGKEGTLTAQDTANIYGITVDKVNLKGDKLSGAEFSLYYGNDETTALKDTPVYTSATVNGALTFQGLNPGTYWLVETKAPDGYKVMSKALKIVIDKKDPDEEPGYAEEVTILNTANVSLPITGGIGTLIFTFSGIALMGAAALLYIRSRKKKATEA
ncbi:MAG: SpaH/EbpB family LPXTG-anchored major pilin [Acutalibacteraceae bacterium]